MSIVKGFDFKGAIGFLSSLSGYRLKNNEHFQKKSSNNANLEIPEFIVEKIMNQNYELLQIESFIEKIKNEISEYTEILCSIRNEKNIVPELCKSIEDRLAKLDGDLAYWTFERNRIWKEQKN